MLESAVVVRSHLRMSLLLLVTFLGLGTASQPAFAQITVSGIADKQVYSDTATLTVVTQAGHSFSATLNGTPVPAGATVKVTRMDYYDLWAWRTNLSAPFDVTNVLVRFIVLASDRGTPERGLMKWTPYPHILSTSAEFAGARLHVMTPRSYPLGLPIPVIARVDDGQGRERRCNGEVTAPGFAGHRVAIIRGVGSGFLPAATNAGPLDYNAQLHSLEAPRQINIDPNTVWTSVSGVLEASTSWPEHSRIHLTGHFAVPAGRLLTIGAGTIVKLNPLVNITNSGTLLIDGTPERPVVFTAGNIVWPEKNAGAWGGFLLRGSSAQLVANGTIFAGGGGAPDFDFSPSASHKSEQAVFLVHSGGKLSLTNCAIINTAGQVHNGHASELVYDHCLAQRAVTGGECSGNGTVIINHSAFIDFPGDDRPVDAAAVDGDYDGLYFTEGTHVLLNSLVGFCLDDALDSGSGGAGTMWVSNCWVESALHEAHAWSGEGRQCWTYDTVLMNCGQGLENGYSMGSDTPLCHAERMLSTANSVGIRVGDNYDWSYLGFLKVTNSLVLYNYRDLFMKTWNAANGSSWDTNSWMDRVEQCHFGTNFLSTTDPRFPSNLPWNPAEDGWRLAHWMSAPPDAPVGIGLALRTNRLGLEQITNGVPVRLSSFATNVVAVDYSVTGMSGQVAGGTLTFAPGETVKNIPPYRPATNDQVLQVLLKNPVGGEVTSLAQVWFSGNSGTDDDLDLDGMLDGWEAANGLVIGEKDAGLDPDGDAFTNLQEFLAGTDPHDGSSYLKIESVQPPDGNDGAAVLTFNAVAGKSYTVWFADTLPANPWNNLTNVPAQSESALVTVQDSQATGTRRYYRLQIR
jgi:hypothetical protein